MKLFFYWLGLFPPLQHSMRPISHQISFAKLLVKVFQVWADIAVSLRSCLSYHKGKEKCLLQIIFLITGLVLFKMLFII